MAAKNESKVLSKKNEFINLTEYLQLVENEPIPCEEIDEYKKIQRTIIKRSNKLFNKNKHLLNEVEPLVFVPIKIERIETIHEFYAIQLCQLTIRAKIQEELERFYQDPSEPFDEVEIGDICAVLSDDVWYRGEVIEITISTKSNEARYLVRLIDYGRIIRTKQKRMRLLKGWLAQQGAMIFRCRLVLLDDDDHIIQHDEEIAIFESFQRAAKQMAYGLIYLKHVHGHIEHDYINEVYLFTDLESDLNTTFDAFLLHETIGAFVRHKIRFNKKICGEWFRADKEKSMLPITKLSQFAKKFRIEITHVESPSEFYVKTKTHVVAMKELRKRIDKFIENGDFIKRSFWFKKKCVLVRLPDQFWHRGRICASKKKSCLVFLRDHGNTVTVPVENVIEIPSELSTPPDCAQRCHLNASDEWLSSHTDDFNQRIRDYKVLAVSTTVKFGTKCQSVGVTLWGTVAEPYLQDDKIWQNIGVVIMTQTIMASMEVFIEKALYHYQRRNSVSFTRGDSESDTSYEQLLIQRKLIASYKSLEVLNDHGGWQNSNSTTNRRRVEIWIPPNENENLQFIAAISHLTPDGIIFMQWHDDLETINWINETINMDSVKTNDSNDKSWAEGDACFAKSSQYNEYYRATIVKINPDSEYCVVRFIDYGNFDRLKLMNLRPAMEFGETPSLAHPYYSTNIIARSRLWDTEILEKCRTFIYEKLCQVTVGPDRLNKGDVIPCELTFLVNDKTLYQWMIDNQIGHGTDITSDGEPIVFV